MNHGESFKCNLRRADRDVRHGAGFTFSSYDVSIISFKKSASNRNEAMAKAQYVCHVNTVAFSLFCFFVTISSRLKPSDRLRILLSHHSSLLHIFYFFKVFRLIQKLVTSHDY